MSWDDRLQDPRYESPSGALFKFIYTEVSVEFDKRAKEYQFPDVDGSYIQDMGVSGRRYPLRIIFSGENYDLVANAFEAALAESGIGRLFHPVYGTMDVVPFGTVSRTDSLVDGCNQCVFNLTFFKTLSGAYPAVGDDTYAASRSASTLLMEAQAADFTGQLNVAKESDKVSFKARFDAALRKVKSGFDKITAANKATSDRFNNVFNSVSTGIDILVEQPTTLAFQTSILINTPAQMTQSFNDRIAAYGNLLSGLIDGDDKVQANSNNFANDDLFVSGVQNGAILASINNEYTSRIDALLQAEALLDSLDSINEWRENNFTALGQIDGGGSYSALKAATEAAAAYLLKLSFALAQEYTIELDRNRSIIDLCGQLYGDIDQRLDFFINTNDFSGDEIIEIPRGRRVVYFR